MKKILSGLLLLWASAAAAQAPPNLSALIEAYDNPVLGASWYVRSLTIGISNITIELGSGQAVPVKIGDEVVGIFFSGQGRYSYRTADPIERGVVLYAADKASKIKIEKKDDAVVLSDTFSTMFLRTGGVTLPELPTTTPGAPIPEPFNAHKEAFKRAQIEPGSHLLVQQRLDRPKSPVAWIEFTGNEETLYVLDTIDQKSESLISLVRNMTKHLPKLRNDTDPIVISEQPVGRDRRELVEPPYVLSAIDYTLIGNRDETMRLSIDETLTARSRPQRAFRFDLISRVYDTDGNARRYVVDKVSDGSGAPLQFHHDAVGLLVVLPTPLAANAAAKVHFEISGNILHRPLGDSHWWLTGLAWFPQPKLNGQHYTIHSTVKVHKPWQPFASGETVRREAEGDYNVVESRVEKPVQFATAHAGKYAVSEEKKGELTIRVASYAGNNERAMKHISTIASQIIEGYQPWLGPFPYKELTIVEIPGTGFSIASPAMMLITGEIFDPSTATANKGVFDPFAARVDPASGGVTPAVSPSASARRSRVPRGNNRRIALEIAHQYWGYAVQIGSRDEQWLSDSFAEYCSSIVLGKMMTEIVKEQVMPTWQANAQEATAVASIAMAHRVLEPKDYGHSRVMRRYLLHDKGAILLASLHKQLGDQKFFTFLRSLQGFFVWKFLTTKEMARLLQRVDDGKDYMPWLERYYWGTEMPETPK